MRRRFPVYEGVLTFPEIEGPEDAEDFSWKVDLGEDQALRSVDEGHAEVYYVEDEQVAFSIEPLARMLRTAPMYPRALLSREKTSSR